MAGFESPRYFLSTLLTPVFSGYFEPQVVSPVLGDAEASRRGFHCVPGPRALRPSPQQEAVDSLIVYLRYSLPFMPSYDQRKLAP